MRKKTPLLQRQSDREKKAPNDAGRTWFLKNAALAGKRLISDIAGEIVFSISEILDLAIRIEENGEYFYRKALEKIEDPLLTAMLQRVADDEVLHRERFIKMKQSYGAQGIESLLCKLSGGLLQETLGDRGFSLDETDFAALPDERSILQVAIGFEEDSITFYEMIGGFVEDVETLRHLNSIIEEEKRHITILEERIGMLPG